MSTVAIGANRESFDPQIIQEKETRISLPWPGRLFGAVDRWTVTGLFMSQYKAIDAARISRDECAGQGPRRTVAPGVPLSRKGPRWLMT